MKPFLLERYFARYEFSTPYLLSSSDCDGLEMSELVAWADPESRQLWERLRLGYTESRGLPALREEVARLYEGVSPEEVLIAVPEECIFLALHALLRPGERVVCTWPGYQSLYEVAESLGCTVERWQPREEPRWSFDLEELERLLRPETRLLIVNFPHNPTGALPTRAEFERILELAASRGTMVFCDEMYRMMELDSAERLPSACERPGPAIVLSGMSKAFGLAGLRIGWLIVRDRELYRQIEAFKDYTTICSSAPSEILALLGLRSKARILERHARRIGRNLALLDEFFERQASRLRWARPRAGTIGLARLLEEPSASALCDAAMREAGVLLLPSTVYEFGDRHVRLGFGRENLPESLARFEEFLNRRGRST